jgi:hypothetical protein
MRCGLVPLLLPAAQGFALQAAVYYCHLLLLWLPSLAGI